MLGVRFGHVRRPDEDFADEDDGQNDAHHAQRIGHGAAQGGAVGVDAHLLQRLLRGAERRGVGRGSAEDAGRVGHGDVQREAHAYGERGADQHYGDGRRQQAQAVGAQRVEETRPDLQTEGVDEDDESETFGIGQHLRVDRESEMPGQNAGEEDERHAQRYAEKADFTESDADRRDERDHHDGLQRRMFDE